MKFKDITLSLTIFFAISLGLIFPEFGLFFRDYLIYFLMIIMFFICLKINLIDFKKIKARIILDALLFIFIFMPLLSLVGILFKPSIFAGILLAFSCPSATASAFFSDAFKGNPSLAIIITILSTLISIVSLPITMLIGVGISIKFDAILMMLNLTQIIIIPLFFAILMKKYLKNFSKKVLKYDEILSRIMIIFVLYGGVASGINYIQNNINEFLEINFIITLLLTIALLITYFFGKIFDKQIAITLSITTFMKNGVLALVIGSLTFGSDVMPVLIANIIDQSILLIILGFF